jgi:hypothetical protein
MHCKHSPALTTTTAGREIVMATPSYRERMKAQRAEARAKREAEQAEYRKQLELVYEVRRLALDAVKEEIRARGDKVQLYSRASLQAMADESISPFLKAQASLKRMQVARTRTRMIERNSKHLSDPEIRANGGLLLNETRAQNGAGE